MTFLLVLHAVLGTGIVALNARLYRLAWLLGSLPMVAALGYVAFHRSDVLDGQPVTEHHSWVSGLDLAIDLRLDGFGLLMVLVVSGIGLAVMAYASRYFSPSPASGRMAGLLVLFSGSMLGLVLADHLIFLFLCWELTSITSWLLIGSKNTDPAARSGALHALLVTSAGGMALLAGLILLGQAAGTYSLSELLAAPPAGGRVGAALGLILVGIMTKSAQFPTHAWLPGAMVAPTPVSAYLHSATMVKAGIYLAARLAPAFAVVGHWRTAVTVVGLTTLFVGGLRALRQKDLKLLLAMGTISQLGFLLVLLGIGRPEATQAGLVLLLGHALFKAALFLVVGIVDHQAGTRDLRELPGFGAGWGPVQAVTVISAASMAGLPPLLGFVAKEAAFEAFAHEGFWGGVTLAGLVGGSVLTFAYSYRMAAALLARPAAGVTSPPPPTLWFLAPAALLTGLTVLGGVATGLFDPLADGAGNAVDGRIGPVHLALWHGFGLPLYMSALVVGLGIVMVLARQPVARIQAALRPRVGGEEAFAGAVRGLYAIARRVTPIVQNGSLPIYCAVILSTAVLLPAGWLVSAGTWQGWPDLASSPIEALLAGALVATALAAATATRRVAAVMLLGAVGYGMGLIFVLQGAPDLALTQFTIETLAVVIFLLVLRRLPDSFRPQPGRRALTVRVLVASAVAVGVFCFALISAEMPDRSVSDGLVARSYPEAGGKNVVNVVLIDFRGLDTLGEISVLVTAALGIVALSRAGRSGPDREEEAR